MKRILFAAVIGLIFTSCQKQIDATTSTANTNNNNTNFGVSGAVTSETIKQGLLAYYTFTGNAQDVSGNANDGVVHGAKLVSDRFGKATSAYSFTDASGNYGSNYIEINTLHASLVTYSVSGWFQKASNSVNTGGTIFAGDHPASGPGDLNFAIAPTNSAELNAKNQTNISVGITTETVTNKSANYSDGIWHSFVITFNSNTTALAPTNFQMYIDGVLVPTQGLYKSLLTQDSAPVNSSALPVILGNSQGQNNSFPGTIDDVRVFNRVLNQAEVTYLANEK